MVSPLSLVRRLDPLVWFFAAGLALFLVLDAAGLAGDKRTIAVDEARLAAFLAGQGGQAPRDLDALSRAERRALLAAYVREEALYRDALGLGLDRGDSAIRRRLVQSLEFSLQDGSGGADEPPSEAELRAYFAAHRERYAESAKVRFSHVFFDKAERGAGAAAAALAALPRLRDEDWLGEGDRYPYQREYDASEAVLASEMGREAAQRVFALPMRPALWQGPIESDLGFHLVRVEARTPQREPAFEQVRDELVQAVTQEKRALRLRAVIDRIVDDYEVDVSPSLQKKLG